ncbi:DNA-binding response regulator [Paucibacter sp. KBW04]|nr:DNA-binding response regulator [Paucibacter sp. KBW04]
MIDDQPEELRQLADLLRLDYRLTSADSGHGGLQRAQALQPALILLDLNLPDMDGLATCGLLKADPLTAQIPVIFLSADNSPERRVQGLTRGGVDYIGKPFLPDEVQARVRVHLHLHQRLSRAEQGQQTSSETPARNPDELLVQGAVQYIRDNLAHLPSVADVARKIGLSEKRLLALFREHLGLTVSGFISDERVRTGQRLLGDTAMSIHDIASTVGFQNAGNFATAFRERFGVTPLAYRQTARDAATPNL